MVDVLNLFLAVFSGIVDSFVSLTIGGYSFGSLIFGGFVIGVVLTYVISVLRR